MRCVSGDDACVAKVTQVESCVRCAQGWTRSSCVTFAQAQGRELRAAWWEVGGGRWGDRSTFTHVNGRLTPTSVLTQVEPSRISNTVMIGAGYLIYIHVLKICDLIYLLVLGYR